MTGTFTASLTGAPIAQGERSHAAISDPELGQAATTTAVDQMFAQWPFDTMWATSAAPVEVQGG